MKKLISMVLVLMLVCTGVFAVSAESAYVPIGLATQLAVLELEMEPEDLLGEWRGCAAAFLGIPGIFEFEDTYPLYSVTINADGTGILKMLPDREVAVRYEIIDEETENAVWIYFYEMDSDESIAGMAIAKNPDSDLLSNYREYMLTSEPYIMWLLSAISEDLYFNGLYMRDWEAAQWPETNTAAVEADFEGVWELVDASVDGRALRWGINSLELYPGMIFEYDASNHMLTNEDLELRFYIESVENGQLSGVPAVEGSMRYEAVTCSMLADGTMLVVLDGYKEFHFQEKKIDPLSVYSDKDTIKAVQAAMNEEGFECGTPDGIAGKKTAAAISGFQAENGLTETGTVTYELIKCLKDLGYDI